MNVIYTCVGKRDLRAATAQDNPLGGPVADAIRALSDRITDVVLWFDCVEQDNEAQGYLRSLRKLRLNIHPQWMGKADPTDFTWVFRQMRLTLETFERDRYIAHRFYLVGPGTPTMATCTILLSRLDGRLGDLVQTDEKNSKGCRFLQLPMQVHIEDGPDPTSLKGNIPIDSQLTAGGAIVISASTQQAWRDAERAAKSNWPVLILGASGTGKEELARHLHECRGHGEFVPVNCGAIPENLIESELFGHEKGAFTGAVKSRTGVFEAAGDGTVFLDEIGELPLTAQVRLLRVLQERKIRRVGSNNEVILSCRVVAATHRDLLQRMQEGSFREDLYYRMAALIIRLEPLAQRPEDLQKMINIFWKSVVQENLGFPGQELTSEAVEVLLAYEWPGNVRELRTVLVRAAFLARGPKVGKEDVERAIGGYKTIVSLSPTQVDRGAFGKTVTTPDRAFLASSIQNINLGIFDFRSATKAFQHQLIEEVLAGCGRNKTKAARELKISPQHLCRILKEEHKQADGKP